MTTYPPGPANPQAGGRFSLRSGDRNGWCFVRDVELIPGIELPADESQRTRFASRSNAKAWLALAMIGDVLTDAELFALSRRIGDTLDARKSEHSPARYDNGNALGHLVAAVAGWPAEDVRLLGDQLATETREVACV